MISVLHVGLSCNPGGVENLVLNYNKHVDNSIVRFDYIDIYGDGLAFSNDIAKLGGTIHTLPNYKRHLITSIIEFFKVLKKNDYDLIHVHMQSAANIIPIVLPLLFHKKVIAHSHSSSTPEGILRKVLNAINIHLLRNAKIEKWACGLTAGRWMWGDCFCLNNIIPNAIEYEDFVFNSDIRNSMREEYGFNKDDKIIGFVGRFGDEKNTFFLLDILDQLLKISNNYYLVTVGGNGLFNEFLAEVQSRHLGNNYFSAGITDNVKVWYQLFDAFILPSYFEGFPIVGLEAQASGLPCFFSDRISSEINISNKVHFLPINNHSEETWAHSINEYIKNNYKRDSSEYQDIYKIENATKFLQDKYMSLVNGD